MNTEGLTEVAVKKLNRWSSKSPRPRRNWSLRHPRQSPNLSRLHQ